MTKNYIRLPLLLLPLFCLPEAGQAQPPAQTYAVEAKRAERFMVRTATAGEWELSMRFAVFYSSTDPKMEMRGGAAGVRYNVVSWYNEASDDEGETVQQIEDFASVGDGFDPQILRGSTSFRTSDLFEAAQHVSLTAESVRQEQGRWIYTFPENPGFTLRAELSLPDDGAPPVLRYELTPKMDGYFSGDTTQAFEYVARHLYGFRDYRTNALGSLNDTLRFVFPHEPDEIIRIREIFIKDAVPTDRARISPTYRMER